MRCLLESDGCVLLNSESYDWFQWALDGRIDPDKVHIYEWRSDEGRLDVRRLVAAPVPRLDERGDEDGHVHLHSPVHPEQWVPELSQHDAAWLHVFRSRNGGDIRRAECHTQSPRSSATSVRPGPRGCSRGRRPGRRPTLARR